MNLRCRQGDLALVIKSAAGNEGAIVRVGKFLGESPLYRTIPWFAGEGPCWLVTFAHPANSINSKTGKRLQPFAEGPFPDAWLQPIRGNPKTTEETKKDRTLSHA